MRIRVIFGLAAAAAMILIGAPAALAAGAGAESFTQTWHNVTETDPSVNPCTAAPGTVTLTYNAVFHVTTLADGTYWATFTQEGTFSFVPSDSSQPSYTGHFAIWDGDNWNNQNTTETGTFTVIGTGSDGSRLTFHETEHVSSSATGATISFDKLRCG